MVPNKFVGDWLEQHYLPTIFRAISSATNREYELTFAIPKGNGRQRLRKCKRPKIEKKEERATDWILKPSFTFENLVVSDFNKVAHAAALAVAEAPGKTNYNPLFIYGGTGTGKTHTLQAIAHFIRDEHSDLRVMYVTCEKFMNDYIRAISHRTTAEFHKVYRGVDVLLFDDAHDLANREGTQNEFFHTFNTLHQRGKQIVITSDRPPDKIKEVEARICSRFFSGLITEIQSPEFEARLAILKKEVKNEGIDIPTPILEYIAENIQTNIKRLKGCLISLLVYSSVNSEDINLEMARKAVREYTDRQSVVSSPELIINEVAKSFKVNKNDIISKRRTKEIALARQVAMYIIRQKTNLSLSSIGNIFSGRDHSTVIYACKLIDREMVKNEDFNSKIKNILNNISKKTG